MLELALNWADVEKAAMNRSTCIRDGMPNHDKAREDWEGLPGRVEYWLSPERQSYSRVIRLTYLWDVKALWLLDYCAPFSVAHINQVSEALDGWLLVSRSGDLYSEKASGTLAEFPLQALTPPDGVIYFLRPLHEQQWVLIQCAGKAAVGARPMKEPVQQPVYDDD